MHLLLVVTSILLFPVLLNFQYLVKLTIRYILCHWQRGQTLVIPVTYKHDTSYFEFHGQLRNPLGLTSNVAVSSPQRLLIGRVSGIEACSTTHAYLHICGLVTPQSRYAHIILLKIHVYNLNWRARWMLAAYRTLQQPITSTDVIHPPPYVSNPYTGGIIATRHQGAEREMVVAWQTRYWQEYAHVPHVYKALNEAIECAREPPTFNIPHEVIQMLNRTNE